MLLNHAMWFLSGALSTCAVAVLLCAFIVRRRRERDRGVEERIRRNEQLAYADTLAGGLIHEIKNPLNTLSMNLQLLAEDYNKDFQTPEERRALKRIQLLQSEIARLTSILDDFLNFVRIHRLTLVECDINKLVDEILTFVKPEMDSNRIELRHSYSPLPKVQIDAGIMKQVLLNLLLNAEQAMTSNDTREIIVRTSQEDKSVRLDVIDTGRGIAPENMEKIFETFYSTRKNGTGLGLPTARRIVEEHGGRLVAHSEVARGSCFTILLPIKNESVAKAGERLTAKGQTESMNEEQS